MHTIFLFSAYLLASSLLVSMEDTEKKILTALDLFSEKPLAMPLSPRAQFLVKIYTNYQNRYAAESLFEFRARYEKYPEIEGVLTSVWREHLSDLRAFLSNEKKDYSHLTDQQYEQLLQLTPYTYVVEALIYLTADQELSALSKALGFSEEWLLKESKHSLRERLIRVCWSKDAKDESFDIGTPIGRSAIARGYDSVDTTPFIDTQITHLFRNRPSTPMYGNYGQKSSLP